MARIRTPRASGRKMEFSNQTNVAAIKTINGNHHMNHKLRIFGARLTPSRIVRFVKTFGFAAAYGRIGMEIGQLISSLSDGEAAKLPVIDCISGIDLGSEPLANVTVSVVIPVKDAGEELRALLSLLVKQRGFSKVEIVVVDSGSTDRSVETAREFGAKVLQILPEMFSHSYARNLAAEHASGDYILFTVQDALPSSDRWLHELLSALKNNNVAAVSCAECPREDADLFYRACSWGHYEFLEVGKRDRIMSMPKIENYLTMRTNAGLSNLACLMPRQLFLQYKFRGNFAEDLELGLRLIRDGYHLAMLSSTRVIHSHNRPAYYHLKRNYADVLLLCKLFPDFPIVNMNPYDLMKNILFVHDVVHSLADHLTSMRVNCLVSHMSQVVLNHYQNSINRNQRAVSLTGANGSTDEGLTLFLIDIRNRFGSLPSIETDHRNTLVRSMRNAIETILLYMDEFYELVDEKLLTEFRASLFKLLAAQCGAHLAMCYARGSEQTKMELEALNKQLTQSV